jgi:hypothetical protein
MTIHKSIFNQIIAQDVMSGKYPAYINSKNSKPCWSLYRGKKAMFSPQDLKNPVNTLILHSPHKSTYLFLSCDAREIAEYITNHEMNFAKTLEDDNRRAEFIANNEWARQDEL